MQVSVLVTAGLNSPAAVSALLYCRALVNQSVPLHQVFFYQDGVQLALANRHSGPGEVAIASEWQAWVQAHGVSAMVCTASAVRRGVFDDTAAQQYHGKVTLAQGFTLAGLGAWAEALKHSHKVISF